MPLIGFSLYSPNDPLVPILTDTQLECALARILFLPALCVNTSQLRGHAVAREA